VCWAGGVWYRVSTRSRATAAACSSRASDRRLATRSATSGSFTSGAPAARSRTPPVRQQRPRCAAGLEDARLRQPLREVAREHGPAPPSREVLQRPGPRICPCEVPLPRSLSPFDRVQTVNSYVRNHTVGGAALGGMSGILGPRIAGAPYSPPLPHCLPAH